MRKTIMIAVCLAVAVAAKGQTVYTRSANADAPSTADVSECYGNGTYQATAASTFSPAWIGKSGVGPISSPSATATVAEDSYSQSIFTWGGSYTTFGTLVISVNGSCTVYGAAGQCAAAYSTNGFSTYTTIGLIPANTTSTISATLPTGTNLSTVQISLCQSSYEGIPDTGAMTINDVWATGTDAAPPSGQDGGTFTTGMLEFFDRPFRRTGAKYLRPLDPAVE